MPKEEYFKGEKLRYYGAGRIWVSKSGNVVGTKKKKKNSYGMEVLEMKSLRINKDSFGKYVINSWNEKILVAKAVLVCFGPSVTQNGNYMVNHKDGKIDNCDAGNLEWIPKTSLHTADPKFTIKNQNCKIDVFKIGKIKVDGKDQTFSDGGHFDPDMDLYWPGKNATIKLPNRSLSGKHQSVDDLMEMAGYVQGKKETLQEPVILHIDGDIFNCDSDNLLWVEKTDSRYVDYMEKVYEYRKNVSDRINKGKTIPKDWVV